MTNTDYLIIEYEDETSESKEHTPQHLARDKQKLKDENSLLTDKLNKSEQTVKRITVDNKTLSKKCNQLLKKLDKSTEINIEINTELKQLRKEANKMTESKKKIKEGNEVTKETKELRDKLEAFLDKCYFYSARETGFYKTYSKQSLLKEFDEVIALGTVEAYLESLKELIDDESIQSLYVDGCTVDKGISIYAYEIITGTVYALQDGFLDLPRGDEV